MAKKLPLFTMLVIGLLGLTACSSVSVTTDYDHSASFDQYRTYLLAPDTGKIALSPSTETSLRDALNAAMASRGISELSEGADLHVVRHISTQEKVAVNQSSDWGYYGVPYRYGRYGMWATAPRTYTNVSQYTEGTLILDFVDARTHKLVFRGVATGTISDSQTNAENIREAVEKMMEKFPVASQQH